jgi:uncharacterized protein
MAKQSMRYLLDVNLWVALFDDAHTHSARANAFIEKRGIKIATCPMIENAVIRILNLPNYGLRGAVGIKQVQQQLNRATNELDHQFWADDVSLCDDKCVNFDKIFSHNQITDVYLLALAVSHGGALVTFDQRIALAAVNGAAARHLVVLQ